MLNVKGRGSPPLAVIFTLVPDIEQLAPEGKEQAAEARENY